MSAPMPNPFDTNSAADVPSAVDEAGASAPAPPQDVPADIPVSDGILVTSLHREMEPLLAHVPSETEDDVSRAASSDNFIGHLIHYAGRLALPAFVPDEASLWDAMHNPSSPRALEGEPTWDDEPPLFLRMAL